MSRVDLTFYVKHVKAHLIVKSVPITVDGVAPEKIFVVRLLLRTKAVINRKYPEAHDMVLNMKCTIKPDVFYKCSIEQCSRERNGM